jgi:hypothetical protein
LYHKRQNIPSAFWHNPSKPFPTIEPFPWQSSGNVSYINISSIILKDMLTRYGNGNIIYCNLHPIAIITSAVE